MAANIMTGIVDVRSASSEESDEEVILNSPSHSVPVRSPPPMRTSPSALDKLSLTSCTEQAAGATLATHGRIACRSHQPCPLSSIEDSLLAAAPQPLQ
jgi:hypothetical protein